MNRFYMILKSWKDKCHITVDPDPDSIIEFSDVVYIYTFSDLFVSYFAYISKTKQPGTLPFGTL